MNKNAKHTRELQIIMGRAKFDLRTAGVIDLTPKSGLFEPHGSATLYAGSHREIAPSIAHGGSSGAFSYFVSGDYLRNDLGIESPDGSSTPSHDTTKQYHGFGYFEYILDPNNRLTWVLGKSHGKFQIPDQWGLTPSLGLTVAGLTTFRRQKLDENQTEMTLDLQTSFIARYSSLTFAQTRSATCSSTESRRMLTSVTSPTLCRAMARAYVRRCTFATTSSRRRSLAQRTQDPGSFAWRVSRCFFGTGY